MVRPYIYSIEIDNLLNLPTRTQLSLNSKKMAGFFFHEDAGEGAFIPTPKFLKQLPLWRIDVLQDLIHDLEIVRRHSIAEWSQALAKLDSTHESRGHLSKFIAVCNHLGVHLPEDIESLIGRGDAPLACE